MPDDVPPRTFTMDGLARERAPAERRSALLALAMGAGELGRVLDARRWHALTRPPHAPHGGTRTSGVIHPLMVPGSQGGRHDSALDGHPRAVLTPKAAEDRGAVAVP